MSEVPAVRVGSSPPIIFLVGLLGQRRGLSATHSFGEHFSSEPCPALFSPKKLEQAFDCHSLTKYDKYDVTVGGNPKRCWICFHLKTGLEQKHTAPGRA